MLCYTLNRQHSSITGLTLLWFAIDHFPNRNWLQEPNWMKPTSSCLQVEAHHLLILQVNNLFISNPTPPHPTWSPFNFANLFATWNKCGKETRYEYVRWIPALAGYHLLQVSCCLYLTKINLDRSQNEMQSFSVINYNVIRMIFVISQDT